MSSSSPNHDSLVASSSEPAENEKIPRRSPQRPSGLQPKFNILLCLTFLTAFLLLPFVFSDHYLDLLRSDGADLHSLLRGEIYKQTTGYIALAFTIFEMVLIIRKRGRGWLVRIKLPGSMNFWRSTHIFLGVAMLAMVGIHTLGANGANFNAVFLWIFFAVTLSALIGVVAETGLLESPRRYFGQLPWMKVALTKGPLIRSLRAVWLTSHIFFVSLFCVMLVMHIMLVYYY